MRESMIQKTSLPHNFANERSTSGTSEFRYFPSFARMPRVFSLSTSTRPVRCRCWLPIRTRSRKKPEMPLVTLGTDGYQRTVCDHVVRKSCVHVVAIIRTIEKCSKWNLIKMSKSKLIKSKWQNRALQIISTVYLLYFFLHKKKLILNQETSRRINLLRKNFSYFSWLNLYWCKQK